MPLALNSTPPDSYRSSRTPIVNQMAESSCKGIIMLGGPSTDSWFRPLSMTVPKPLFPVAGRPLVDFPLEAFAGLGNSLQEVLLIGFYDASLFDAYIQSASARLGIRIKYLQEPKSLGTGGGLYHFKEQILEGSPKTLFIVYGDICCSFPFAKIFKAHQETSPHSLATIMATHVPREQASNYGCLVKESPNSCMIQHYVEKPETFISDLISCGVYLMEASVLSHVESLPGFQKPSYESSTPILNGLSKPSMVRLEQDILTPLASLRKVAVYETKEFWCQVKTANSAITANRLYLEDALFHGSTRLTATTANHEYECVGGVSVDPAAVIHAGAKLGPNVSIGSNCVVDAGARLRDCIVLEGSRIGENAVVISSIVGWNSGIGPWCRIEGSPTTACETMVTLNGVKMPSITVLGGEVSVTSESVIRNCIVLPHKELQKSYHNEILL